MVGRRDGKEGIRLGRRNQKETRSGVIGHVPEPYKPSVVSYVTGRCMEDSGAAIGAVLRRRECCRRGGK